MQSQQNFKSGGRGDHSEPAIQGELFAAIFAPRQDPSCEFFLETVERLPPIFFAKPSFELLHSSLKNLFRSDTTVTEMPFRFASPTKAVRNVFIFF